MLMHADSMESIRPLGNDDRRAVWAGRYYAMGLHRQLVPNCPQSDEFDDRTPGRDDYASEQRETAPITSYAARRGE